MTAGDIYTITDDGKCGFSDDSGPASMAKLKAPGA